VRLIVNILIKSEVRVTLDTNFTYTKPLILLCGSQTWTLLGDDRGRLHAVLSPAYKSGHMPPAEN